MSEIWSFSSAVVPGGGLLRGYWLSCGEGLRAGSGRVSLVPGIKPRIV